MKTSLLVMFALAAGLPGCNAALEPVQLAPRPGPPRFSVSTRPSEKLVTVSAPSPRGPGPEALVDCATCHARRLAEPMATSTEALEAFHRGFKVEHGGTECVACHRAERGDELHLATGEPLALADAVRLCAQCHGPQYRDYQHGAHGGAVGYWDLSRGPREKNHCVDCHDPHAPKYQGGLPVAAPRNRQGSATHE